MTSEIISTRCVSGLRPSLARLRYGLKWFGKSELLDAMHMMQIANKSKKWCISFPYLGFGYQMSSDK